MPQLRPPPSVGFGLVVVLIKLGFEVFALGSTTWREFRLAADFGFDLLVLFPVCVALFELVARAPLRFRPAALGAGLALIWAVLFTDLVVVKYFRNDLLSVAPQLLRFGNVRSLAHPQLDALPWFYIGAALLLLGALFSGFRTRLVPGGRIWIPALLLLAGRVFALYSVPIIHAGLDAIVPARGAGFAESGVVPEALADMPLHAARRPEAVLLGPPAYLPSTVVLFINESLPWDFPSGDNPRDQVFSAILGTSRLPESEWVVFRHAYTNSVATDISVPLILTGVEPTASVQRIQQMPLLHAYAKSRGYHTAFFTSQDFGWQNLGKFIRSENLDEFLSGDMTGQPNATLLGIDDAFITERVVDCIHRCPSTQRLFLVVNNNALHLPYQLASTFPVPPYSDPRQRAAYILTECYRRIFQALAAAGRLQDGLIMITSDHGETHPFRRRNNARLDSQFEEVINVPLAIRLPPGAPGRLREGLIRNQNHLVQNLDLAASLGELLAATPPEPLAFSGNSLFHDLPEDRVIISLSNSAWHHWKPNTFGLITRNRRLISDERTGLHLYDVATDPEQKHEVSQGADLDFFRTYIGLNPLLSSYAHLRPE